MRQTISMRSRWDWAWWSIACAATGGSSVCAAGCGLVGHGPPRRGGQARRMPLRYDGRLLCGRLLRCAHGADILE
jgi:hypothetical protein